MNSKERFSTQLPRGLADQVRRTVLDLQRHAPGVTLSSFTADALTSAIEGVHNGSFQVTHPDKVQLRRGRTLSDSTGIGTSVDATPQEEA